MKKFKGFFAVLIVLIIIDRLIAFYNVDMILQRLLYDADKGWYLGDITLFRTLFVYGEKAAWIPVVVCGLLLVASFLPVSRKKKDPQGTAVPKKHFMERVRKYRMSFVFVILLMVIGPGLIVNVALKDNLGRPRPREVTEFGGRHDFTGTWTRGEAGRNSSFPSGHASVAFYMMFPFFLLRNKRKRIAYIFLLAGIVYGFLMGAARMAQGGHFLSDVMWAGGIVYLTGFLLEKKGSHLF